jgi:sugar transferase (PEP-CTERM system associated)
VIRVFNLYVSAKSLLLMMLESFLIVASLIGGAKLRFWSDPDSFEFYLNSPSFLLQVLTVLLVFETCCYYNELYDLNVVRVRGQHLVRLAQSLGAGCILLGVLYYFLPWLLLGRGVLIIAVGLVAGSTFGVRAGLDRIWASTVRENNVLILGNGELALSVAREFERRADLSFRVVGFLARESTVTELFGRPVFAGELSAVAREQRVSRIVVALADQRGALPTRDLVRLRVQGVEIEDAHSALAGLTGRVWLRAVRPSWFVFSGGFRRSGTTLLLKRALDLALSLVGVILFSPVIALIAIAVWFDSRGPALYRQPRVGLGGRVFNVVKFRSMRIDAEAKSGAQWALKDDLRITRVGRFLRKYRLDELPQFFNVIRGEMSFVGPRPERPCFVEQLREQIPFYDERHSVRPGITGWAQVEFTYGASVEDALRKLEYDLFYLKNMSILFDIAIVFRTARIVLFGVGSR